MKISVIIPTFNRRELLKSLLRHLKDDQESIRAVDHEIIVVDDRSSDGTSEMVSSLFPDVRLLLGQGKNQQLAKRMAVEASTGDYVVMLDDDAVPRAGWLARVLPAIEKGEQIIQGKLVFLDLGQREERDESDKRLFRAGFRWDMAPLSILNGGYRPQYLGCCHEFGCFVARDVLRTIPLDDLNLFRIDLGESASFYIRATQSGFRVYFEPQVVIDHLGASAGGSIDRFNKVSTKRKCTDYTTGVVHNYMVLARMHRPFRIPLLIPYYLAGGLYLSIRQRKNCLKYFVSGLYQGLTRKLEQIPPYANL